MNSRVLDEENREEEYQSSCLNGVGQERAQIVTIVPHHNVDYFDH